MSRPRVLIISAVTLLLLVGVLCGVWMSAISRYRNPMRSFYEIPKFQRAVWMDESLAGNIERLMNDVSRTRDWSSTDAAFVMELLRSPRVSEEPPIPLDDVDFSFFKATSDQIAWFRQREGADAALKWDFKRFERRMAWSIVDERLRLGLEIPHDMREYVIKSRVAGLGEEDPSVRIESVSSLIYSRAIEDPDLRMRVEAVRLGDPSADVRRIADQHLQHYDRIYKGVEPSGPTSECNTCP